MSARKNPDIPHCGGRGSRTRISPWRAIAALLLFSASLLSASLPPGEYDVEAVYLLNFGKFVTWPSQREEAPGAAFPICVLGQDPFGKALDATLAGETLSGLKVATRRIQAPREALECRILFISRSEDQNLRRILQVLGNVPVLTVSDLPDFVRRGGMIQFVLQDDKVRFSVNLNSANKAGLTLSSQLLKVASSVDGKPPGGHRH